MLKISKSSKLIFCITVIFFSVFLSQFLCMGINALASQIETSNQVVTPLTLTGMGTLLEPYKISNGADLTNLSAYTNSGGTTKGMYFTISALDLTSDGALEMATVEPIGTTLNPFMGTFDGNNVTLTGATLATNSAGYTGIFGVVKYATIKNLSVQYNKTTTNATYLGGVVASAYHTNIINCHNKTEIENDATTSAVAGVIGYSYNNFIEGCSNMSNIVCTSDGSVVAGVSAYNVVGEITECTNAGDITGDYLSGGIGGAMVTPLATYPGRNNQHNQGNVTGDPNAGGSSETSTSSSWGTIQKCCNYGTITAGSTSTTTSYAGGVMAIGGYPIKNCYNRGTIVAKASKIRKDYETSTKKADDWKPFNKTFYASSESISYYQQSAYAGGIVGRADNPVTLCYNTGSVTGGGTSALYEGHHQFKWGEVEKNIYSGKTHTFVMSYYITDGVVIVEANTQFDLSDSSTCFYSSSINGKNTVSSTNCYSNIQNEVNNVRFEVSSNDYQYRLWDNGAGTWVTDPKLLKSYSYRLNAYSASQKFSSSTLSYTYSDYWTFYSPGGNRLSAKLDGRTPTANYRVLELTFIAPDQSSTYVTSGPAYITAQKYNFTYQANLKTIPSGFSTSIWAIDSTGVINGGYPYIKGQYWQDVASKW